MSLTHTKTHIKTHAPGCTQTKKTESTCSLYKHANSSERVRADAIGAGKKWAAQVFYSRSLPLFSGEFKLPSGTLLLLHISLLFNEWMDLLGKGIFIIQRYCRIGKCSCETIIMALFPYSCSQTASLSRPIANSEGLLYFKMWITTE